MFSSRRVLIAAALGLTVCAPRIALAQQSVVDSVTIASVVFPHVGTGTAPGPETVVAVRAANVSFTVRPSRNAAVWAVLRSPRSGVTNANAARALRASTTGDTVQIELARTLDALHHLELGVPLGAALRIAGDNGGEVRVEGVRGSAEVTHSNGSVTVLDAAGHVLVATSNGNIRVRLVAVERGVPMSFITSNGDIDLTMPADVRATLLIDDSIALQSDFPLASSDTGGARSRLRRLAVNGGGPTIRLFTNNGKVRVHRL
jgi:hypothetical protein